jgi:hypothetical protein
MGLLNSFYYGELGLFSSRRLYARADVFSGPVIGIGHRYSFRPYGWLAVGLANSHSPSVRSGCDQRSVCHVHFRVPQMAVLEGKD